MTEMKLKDLPKMGSRMDTRYGCYGVVVTSMVSLWISQYIHNSGDEHVFDNVLLVMNKSEGSSTMWSAEVFNYER